MPTTVSPWGSDLVFDVNDDSFHRFAQRLESDFSFLNVSRVAVRGETILESEHGGMRILCIHHGNGEVFLPKEYRTQEGDGTPLPKEFYQTDTADSKFVELLRRICKGIATLTPAARLPVDAILNRLDEKEGTYCGDISGELWRLLEQAKRPWSTDAETESAIDELFHRYRTVGFSTKLADSWESVLPGDQLTVTENVPLRVRGDFRCFSLENVNRKTSHVSAVRRLRFLLDTAGGCSPGFDPYRRLPITWQPNYPNEYLDGINFFNNHVVNIPAENSPTHFHPKNPIGGGMPQSEFYLVLDPAVYGLSSDGQDPFIVLYPDLKNLNRYEKVPLRPGMIVYMPPGTGHRGLNVFALIMTVPGFKPGNELYLDRDVFERTGGEAPYNENHLQSKNYERLDELS